MELIRGIHNLRPRHHGCVLTIGNFDGVHLGHQALLRKLKQEGERLGLPSMVMIFEPQPQELFDPEHAPARLTRLRDKCKYISEAGIDYLLCVRFDNDFAACRAEDFVSQLLVDKLNVKFLMVGDDFRFGAHRSGNFAMLEEAGKHNGFSVADTASVCESGKRVSSTMIRLALKNDDLPLAKALLGRDYSVNGRIVHGDELGRTIGFPTANIPLKRLVAPVKGVYAVDVLGLGEKPIHGVANIGTRPTVSGIRQQLEVHLLDVDMDLYGRHIEVVMRKKLRNEQRFASLDELKQQIANDVIAARNVFNQTPRV